MQQATQGKVLLKGVTAAGMAVHRKTEYDGVVGVLKCALLTI
jgi:hypothetical protein